MSQDPFDLLVVCTANICRSPALEAVLRHGAAQHAGLPAARVRVSSAGTRTQPGRAVDPRMRAALERVDVPLAHGGARQVDDPMLAAADLVLVATREHRSELVRRAPARRSHLFTMAEFARYCEAVPSSELTSPDVADRLHAVVEFAGRRRGLLQPRRIEDDDLRDPHGGSRRGYRRCVARLTSIADDILVVGVP